MDQVSNAVNQEVRTLIGALTVDNITLRAQLAAANREIEELKKAAKPPE